MTTLPRRLLAFAALTLLLPASACKKESNNPARTNATSVPATISSGADSSASKTAASEQWHAVEEFSFDWRKNGAPARFRVEKKDLDQPSRLTIFVPGQPDFVLQSEDGLIAYADDFQPDEHFLRDHKNILPSKYLLGLPISPSGNAPPLIFVFEEAEGSDPERLRVLGLGVAGQVKLLFDRELHLSQLRDLDGDGLSEVIGLPCFSQTSGEDILTYDPIHVYRLEADPEPQLKLSLSLTKDYNLQHYYGWAGPDCREDVAVVLHPPFGGKPVIMKLAEAQKISRHK